VTGKIVRIEKPAAKEDGASAYAIAWIKTREVLKKDGGPEQPKAADRRTTQPGDEVPLTMPAKHMRSTDIVYKNGTDGVWILQYRDQRYWAAYPKDYQPIANLETVKHAIKEAADTARQNALAAGGLAASALAAPPAWRGPVVVGTNAFIRDMVFTADAGRLVVGSDDGSIRVFDRGCPDGLPVRELRGANADLHLAVSGDGRTVLGYGCPPVATVFDVDSEKACVTHPMIVFQGGLSADGKQMWADNQVFALSSAPPEDGKWKPVHTFGERTGILHMTRDRKQLITATGRDIEIRDAASYEMMRQFDVGQTNFNSLGVSADERFLSLIGGRDAKIHVWDLKTGREAFAVDVRGACHDFALTPDGKRAAVSVSREVRGKKKYLVEVREVADGSLVKIFHADDVYWPMAMAADGTLAYTRDGHRVEFVDATSLRPVKSVETNVADTKE
jgi:hypothetical protein